MRLEELDWLENGSKHQMDIAIVHDRCMVFRDKMNGRYAIYRFGNAAERWEGVDALSAQAILIHVTSPGITT